MDEDYEDDFETYEDDFESEDEADRELYAAEQPVRAPQAHRGLASALPARSELGLTDLQRTHAAQQSSRWQLLKSKVHLEEAILDNLFDLAPLTQYELYSTGQGPYRGLGVGSCQTNNNGVTDECQTDVSPTEEAACQTPDLGHSHTIRQSVPAKSQGADTDQWLPLLESAGSQMLTLLQKQQQYKPALQFDVRGNPSGVFAGRKPLSHSLTLQGCSPTAMASHSSCSTVMVAYTATERKKGVFGGKGCLCLWDLTSPAMPSHVLVSEGQPSACTFVACPGAGLMVVAGMQEGGLCLWDCSEAAQKHSQHIVNGKQVTSRRPTYSTECSGASAMTACVVAVSALPMQQPGSDQLSNRSSSGQLLAVTEWGIVSLWTVMVLPATAQSADADVGLRTGSWTCLLLTATLTAGSALHPHLSALALDNASQLCMEVGRHAAALAIPANSSDQFLVGMDSTQVLRGSLYGNLYLPKVWQCQGHAAMYSPGCAGVLPPADVTCLSFSPEFPDVFVAGHSTGACVFYSLCRSTALLTIQVLCDSGICGVQWSPSRPTILYVLSERGQLGCLDIISQMFSPISEVQSKGSVTHFQVVVHTMLEGDGKLNKQLLVIVYDDATVDCCLLQQHLVSLLPAEHSQIRKVLKL